MNAKISRRKSCRALPVALALLLTLVAIALAAGNIDPTHKWAWGANMGWLNFAPDYGGVIVYSDHLEGHAWAENIGWIRLGTCTGGSPCTHANTSANNYGVNNDGVGNLSGYAWSASAGWINFAPTGGGVTIDPITGDFDGYAWGENNGWIHFNNHSSYKVNTTWRSAPTLNPIPNADGDGNYTVSWSSVSGATGYTLQEATNSGFTGATTAYSGSGTSTAISGKTPGTYYYRVRASNAGGNSAWSNTRSVVVKAWVYLPLALRDYVTYFEGPWEAEPNNTYLQATGPLISGRNYTGYPNDERDYFSVYVRRSGILTVNITNHTGQLVQLQLFYQGLDNRVYGKPAPPWEFTHEAQPGWYYIYIYTGGGHNGTTPYTLQVTYPQ